MSIQLTEPVDQAAVDRYHRQLYSLDISDYPHWMGVPIRKTPLDLWIYAEIIQRVKPGVIVELGTAHGGSALFFWHMMNLVNGSKSHFGYPLVITIDENECPDAIGGLASRIVHIQSKTQDPECAKTVEGLLVDGKRPVMLSHDAGHLTHEVLADLELYGPLVTPGSYLVVEDTNIEGKPLGHEGVMGPGKAVEQFLAAHPEFEVDEACERFGLTFNPGGWLKRS